jgi:hypothetical protein
MALFSPVLAFSPLGRVLGMVWAFRAIVGGFRAFGDMGALAVRIAVGAFPLGSWSRSVIFGRDRGGRLPFFAIPLPYDILFCARAVLLNQPNKRK